MRHNILRRQTSPKRNICVVFCTLLCKLNYAVIKFQQQPFKYSINNFSCHIQHRVGLSMFHAHMQAFFFPIPNIDRGQHVANFLHFISVPLGFSKGKTPPSKLCAAETSERPEIFRGRFIFVINVFLCVISPKSRLRGIH